MEGTVKLIDANAEELQSRINRFFKKGTHRFIIKTILKDAPAVDAVELVQKWIPVSERLPKPFVRVLVFRNGEISIDYHEEDGWFAFDFSGKRATHWMPLPEQPNREDH